MMAQDSDDDSAKRIAVLLGKYVRHSRCALPHFDVLFGLGSGRCGRRSYISPWIDVFFRIRNIT
jgi:hypothetical protein